MKNDKKQNKGKMVLPHRAYAGVMRISARMIKWSLQSMFIPRKLFWPVDELFFRTICEFEDDCVYVPTHSISLGSLGAINFTDRNNPSLQVFSGPNSRRNPNDQCMFYMPTSKH